MTSQGLRFRRVKQQFPRPVVADAAQEMETQLRKLHLAEKIKAGQQIGITVGSRGIQNIVPLLQTAVAYVRALGAKPYLLAAMGSHGGGTEEGQEELLESLGITEASVGAPLKTCAVSRPVGATAGGMTAYVLEAALEMDGILVINRVKTHTSFKGRVESGLVKKLVVGLGGPSGAKQFHTFGSEELPRLLVEIGEVLLAELPILGGVAVVENAYEETARLAPLEPEQFIAGEEELLLWSKSLMPALPVQQLDLLLIGEMGKNYSGTGVDTNIIGRIRIEGVPEPTLPDIKRVAILDLSEASHGNAHGVGLADFVTKRLVDKIDRPKTYLNSLTSTFVIRSAIPMWFDTEEELVKGAFVSLGDPEPEALRAIIVPNTLYLTDLWVSEALAPEIEGREDLTWDGEWEPCSYDAAGRLTLRC